MVGSYSCSEWLPTVSSDRVDKEVRGKTVVRTSYDGTIWRQSETVFTAKAPRRRERKEQKNLEEQECLLFRRGRVYAPSRRARRPAVLRLVN